MLQRQNAVWKFTGEYAKKLYHLFKKELMYITRIKTVTLKAFPCQLNPTSVEILCSVKYVRHVQDAIEKLTNMLHNLFEHKVNIPDAEKQNVREFVRYLHEHDNTVLCIFDEETRTLTVFGRNYYIVKQVAGEVKEMVTTKPQSVPVPHKLVSITLQKLSHAIYLDFFSAVKIENFIGNISIFFIVLLKTLIVGTGSNKYPQSMI